jgi:lambda repressor-like predicted transcriptional regulator
MHLPTMKTYLQNPCQRHRAIIAKAVGVQV